jgi:hypothetical protein
MRGEVPQRKPARGYLCATNFLLGSAVHALQRVRPLKRGATTTMDELLLVKLMLTAGLIFAASMVIVLMRGGDENEVSTGKPVGRLKRELMEAASALPWILAIGIICVACLWRETIRRRYHRRTTKTSRPRLPVALINFMRRIDRHLDESCG